MLDDMLHNSILVDLTQTLGPDTSMWSEDDPFIARTHADHESDGMYYRYLQMSEHSGTHMDAPVHFGPGQATMDQVPLGSLVVPVAVADARTSTRDAMTRSPSTTSASRTDCGTSRDSLISIASRQGEPGSWPLPYFSPKGRAARPASSRSFPA